MPCLALTIQEDRGFQRMLCRASWAGIRGVHNAPHYIHTSRWLPAGAAALGDRAGAAANDPLGTNADSCTWPTPAIPSSRPAAAIVATAAVAAAAFTAGGTAAAVAAARELASQALQEEQGAA